jgi:flagellin
VSLRINHNLEALRAIGQLRSADAQNSGALQKLSSGLRIQKASDDPSGLVISELFRAQISGVDQALENTQTNRNLLATADSALQEIHDQIVSIRSMAISASQTGGQSKDQLLVQQEAVDQAISSIDRIAGTTRYGREKLIDGSLEFVVDTPVQVNGNPVGITDSSFRRVYFGSSNAVVLSARITQSATRASLNAGIFTNPSGGVLRITGELGVEDVAIPSPSTVPVGVIAVGSIADEVNRVREFTGVYSSGNILYSEEFGSRQMIRVEVISGNYTGQTGLANGEDLEGNFLGASNAFGDDVQIDGRSVRFRSKLLQGDVLFTASAAQSLVSFSFQIERGGLGLSVGSYGLDSEQITIALPSMDSDELGYFEEQRPAGGGTVGGFLHSLISGGSK